MVIISEKERNKRLKIALNKVLLLLWAAYQLGSLLGQGGFLSEVYFHPKDGFLCSLKGRTFRIMVIVLDFR